MKKSDIIKVGVAFVIMALTCSCQSSGLTDEKLINTTMTDWKTALTAQDLDKLMATYSDNYVSDKASGKDAVRERMTKIFEQGWMNNVKVNLKGAAIKFDGDKAEFGPVKFTSDEGMFTRRFTLQKESGTWLLIGSKSPER